MRLAVFAAASVAIGAMGAMGVIAGCTFLVGFDDPLPPLDEPPETGTNMPDSGPPPGDARSEFDPKKSAACKGLPDGHYCGNNQLAGYPFTDDLVACTNGAISDTKICSLRCLHLKNPHPDQCDECSTKTDGGYFCGSDFSGWVATGANTNANVYVHCQSGSQDLIDYCTTCASSSNSKGVGTATCTK